MLIQAFPSGPFETNSYLVVCPSTHAAIVVDPAPGSFQIISDYIANQPITLQKILITHSHWDHIGDTAQFKRHFGIPVYIHPLDRTNLEKPGSDGLPSMLTIQGVEPDGSLDESSPVTVGNLKFQTIHTPGHTPGGVCLYCAEKAVLLSGDTLFRGSIGNLSFPTAEPEKMWVSLKKLSQLPPETKVYPGHGPTTTIGTETWLAHAQEVFGN